MKLIITIKKKSDELYNKEFEFTEFPIMLGRETDNDIILEDPRKIVSRSHAKIISSEGIIQLIDLGSANYTYLNSERIFPNTENEIKTGDIIKVGDYQLDVVIEQENSKVDLDDQKTMAFSSPFDEEVSNITDSIMKLSDKYALDDSPIKSEMLRFSVMQSFERINPTDVSRVLSEYFVNKFMGQDFISQNKKDISLTAVPPEKKQKSKTEFRDNSTNTASISATEYSFSAHFSESVDIILDTVIKLIQGFLHFRQEFFGVTIYQTIPTNSLKDIKDYLFIQDISSEEQRKRINILKEETQKLLTHQLGLLEGYRISVTEGSQSLLQSLDPELIEKETASKQTSPLENILPYSKKLKTLEAIKLSYKKYISDPQHIEKKFFRPPFIKGYQKRISFKNEVNEY
jgi:pSer/pThr/pTyr-binding forkhead associated (FHA) protein